MLGFQPSVSSCLSLAGCKVTLPMFQIQDNSYLLRGCVGMGNYELIPGDAVCILYGGKEPFILRRTVEGHGAKQDVTTSIEGGKVLRDAEVEGDRVFWRNNRPASCANFYWRPFTSETRSTPNVCTQA